MKNNTILENLGFSKDEASIYLKLLQGGKATVSEITRRTGIHRPTVYKVLPDLIEKGVVNVTPKGKQKMYTAESPQKLERILEEISRKFKEEIGELNEVYSRKDTRPLVTYGEGGKAITEVYSDVVHSLKKGDTYYRYSSSGVKDRKNEGYVPKDYREVRDRKGLERYIITNVPTSKTHSQRLGREIKAVPPGFDLFEYNINVIIYGSKVAIVDYNTETTVTIESSKFAEFQKKVFQLLYSKL